MRFLIYEEVPFIVYPRLVPFGTRVQVTGQKIASRPVLFFVVLGIFLFVCLSGDFADIHSLIYLSNDSILQHDLLRQARVTQSSFQIIQKRRTFR